MQKTTLGILGGGQLGRMSALAAARLGIEVIIYTPEDSSPASQVVQETIVAPYDDKTALRTFAEKVSVISYEFENIPIDTIAFLQSLKPVYPEQNLLQISQDRIQEKSYLNARSIPTAQWRKISSPDDIQKTIKEFKCNSLILKTTRFGYDGKGQARFRSTDDPSHVWDELGGGELIAEEVIDFDCEVSVIVARDLTGKMVTYGPMRNEHKNHILHKTTMPSGLSDALCKRAITMTETLAKSINLRGVLALEMFVTKDGRILANEIAPRTHNSGHWSIDACAVSQFENHVRAVCGLPVAAPGRHSNAVMLNLIGDDAARAGEYLTQENACLHLYGKHDIRKGRKMGHVTILETLT